MSTERKDIKNKSAESSSTGRATTRVTELEYEWSSLPDEVRESIKKECIRKICESAPHEDIIKTVVKYEVEEAENLDHLSQKINGEYKRRKLNNSILAK